MICPLREVLLLVLCATLSGTKDSVEIKLWGEQRLAFLRRFLPFERGIPAHDTLNDVINALDEEPVQGLLCRLGGDAAGGGSTRHRNRRQDLAPIACPQPPHMVSAWAARHRLVPGEEAVDDKSNAVAASSRNVPTICPQPGSMPRPSPPPCTPIGALRTGCTGSSMSSSTMTWRG